eukprot:Nitzschia sp. Nitz4//scaffold144_size56818//52986//54372//NITZ4_006549-RA/size56818-snap-gene-0.13-mRNA-1//-1//CDS//3329536552//4142//frame0
MMGWRKGKWCWSLTVVILSFVSLSSASGARGQMIAKFSRGLEYGVTYEAEAFECDENRNLIEDVTTKKAGDVVRICIEPTAVTLERAVVMRRIDFFTFQGTDGGAEQQAIVSPGREGDNTLNACIPGSSICSFSTRLNSDLFVSDGYIAGIGQAFMEYQEIQEVDDDEGSVRRELEEQEEYGDPDVQFAGYWDVSILVPVNGSFRVGGKSFYEIFTDLSKMVQWIIVLGVVAFLIAILVCLAFCILYQHMKDQKQGQLVDGKYPRDVEMDSQASFFLDEEDARSYRTKDYDDEYSDYGDEYPDDDFPVDDFYGDEPYFSGDDYDLHDLDEEVGDFSEAPTIGEECAPPQPVYTKPRLKSRNPGRERNSAHSAGTRSADSSRRTGASGNDTCSGSSDGGSFAGDSCDDYYQPPKKIKPKKKKPVKKKLKKKKVTTT